MSHLSPATFAEALLWAVVAGLVAWLLLRPVRRRSLAGLLASLVITGAATSAGCLWGAVHAMLLPGYDWRVITLVTVFTVLVNAIAAVAVSRHFTHDNRTLHAAVAELGAGRVPTTDGRRLLAEVDDVREQLRRSAEALAATRDRERTLESSRRELVAWVSHDLRAPLAGLRAMSEALEDGVADEPELYYKRIGDSVDRLDHMVQDLFELSRVQAGAVNRSAELLSLEDIVSDAIAAHEPIAAAARVTLTGRVRQRATVAGNASDLSRALSNLVANAIRHTPPGGRVDVDIAAAPEQRGDGAAVQVVVADGCGGIPAEHLPRLFEVGFRGQPARTPGADHDGGAGLGLAITRGIVEAHDGRVDVTNVEGGCAFRIVLPVTSDAASPH